MSSLKIKTKQGAQFSAASCPVKSRTQKNESEENMKNILIIALLAIIGFQWHVYDKLHNDYTNIIIAIQEEIL